MLFISRYVTPGRRGCRGGGHSRRRRHRRIDRSQASRSDGGHFQYEAWAGTDPQGVFSLRKNPKQFLKLLRRALLRIKGDLGDFFFRQIDQPFESLVIL